MDGSVGKIETWIPLNAEKFQGQKSPKRMKIAEGYSENEKNKHFYDHHFNLIFNIIDIYSKINLYSRSVRMKLV